MRVTAVIVGAGEGTRMRGSVPKSYLSLGGRPLLCWALDRFVFSPSIGQIVVVVAARELERCRAMLKADSNLAERPWILQSGGATRQESVRKGLAKIGSDCEIVAIHDAARPFVSSSLIDRCVHVANEKGAAVAALPASDTIKIVSSERKIESTPDRDSLWEVQTPQVFRREWIVAAHAWAAAEGVNATDDATLVERTGKAVYVVDGESTNIKITLAQDLVIAEALLREGLVPR
jgi:2-C-methyl-D-erythritol 4-phosphate cytidylyltransferase